MTFLRLKNVNLLLTGLLIPRKTIKNPRQLFFAECDISATSNLIYDRMKSPSDIRAVHF